MKIAYCFHGCVGGLTGKNCQKCDGAEKVLNLAAELFFQNINSENIDIFIHSWDTNLHDKFIEKYNPKSIITENQLVFDIPAHLPNNLRVQSHYSRWYSAKKVINLKNEYEFQHKLEYDLVILSRHDVCWLRKFNLNRINIDVFNFNSIYKKDYYTKDSQELGDILICSNKKNMNYIVTLYDKLNEYTKPNQCPQYGAISSHFCLAWHLSKINLRSHVKFPYLHYDPVHADIKLIDEFDISIARNIYKLYE